MDLKEEVELLRKENKQLKKLVKELTKRIEELEDKLREKVIPDFVKENLNHRHKKNGQKKGHKGYARHIPERIDVIKEYKLEECPECGGRNLSKVQEVRIRVTTDIPEPQEPINTKHKIPRKYCRDCKKIVEAPVLDALPNARFGLRLMLFVLFLKIGMRLPVENIRELIKNMYNLHLSRGEVIHMLKQLAREFGAYYKELKQKIREAKVRYIDETGRRVNGKNHMIWAFVTKEIALYVIRKSRGHKVPLRVLGKNCGGTNVNDRLSAYYVLLTKTKCVMQVCWSHLLRESKKLAKDFKEGIIIHRRLKRIFKDAEGFNHKGTDKDVERLLERMDSIRKIKFRSITCGKFIRHLCTRDRENLFRFVTDPEIEATSNRVERALRHDVVIRKISGGNRSKTGAKVHETLLSVVQTYRLQDRNILNDGFSYLQNQLQTAK